MLLLRQLVQRRSEIGLIARPSSLHMCRIEIPVGDAATLPLIA
jgi:hypothetical protein